MNKRNTVRFLKSVENLAEKYNILFKKHSGKSTCDNLVKGEILLNFAAGQRLELIDLGDTGAESRY